MEGTRQQSRRKPLVLYVEDNDQEAQTYGLGLSTEDFEVRRLRSQRELFDWLYKRELPNLVVVSYDVREGGISALEEMRKHEEWAHIPVYVISNHISTDEEENSFRTKSMAWLVQHTMVPKHVAQRLRREIDHREGEVG